MPEVSWVQVGVGAVSVLGTAVKLPAAKLDWGEEHRRVVKIRRQRAVMDAVEHPSVRRILETENEWQALNLVALQMFPYKLRLRLAVYAVWVGYLAAVAVVVCSLVFDWGRLRLGAGIFALIIVYFLSYPIIGRLLLHQANRRAYVFCGAPESFRIAKRSMVSRRDDPKKRRHIFMEFDARMDASDMAGKCFKEYAPEANAIWTQIMDEQDAVWYALGDRLRERLVELNERNPKPDLFERLNNRIERGQKRLKPDVDDICGGA